MLLEPPMMAHCHKSATRASKRADVSRLLDPIYASSLSSSSNQNTVYVDDAGDLHDPDYRHFPSLSRPSWEAAEQEEEVFGEAYPSPLFPSRPLSPAPYFSAQLSSSPSSMASNETWLSAAESYETELKGRSWRNEQKLKKRRLEIEGDEHEFVGDESDQEEDSEPSHNQSHDPTSTCSDAVKKEWQALQLQIRIGVFRLKRRVRDSFK